MAHTLAKLFFHVVWSTKERSPLIQHHFRERLYKYMGGIIKAIGADLIEIGGIQDHVDLLICSKPDILISDMIRQIKARSTKWIHTEIPDQTKFRWQEGYGIFSVSFSNLSNTINYIKNQEAHHKKMSYEEEFLLFLTRNEIKYDPRFVLG